MASRGGKPNEDEECPEYTPQATCQPVDDEEKV